MIMTVVNNTPHNPWACKLCWNGPCMCHRVARRTKGHIPYCEPSVPNSASDREVRWPEQDPLVQLYDGTVVRMKVKSYLDQIRKDIETSRRQRMGE